MVAQIHRQTLHSSRDPSKFSNTSKRTTVGFKEGVADIIKVVNVCTNTSFALVSSDLD